MMDIDSDKLPPFPTSVHAQPLSLHALLQSSVIQESFIHLQQPSPNPVVPTHSPPFSESLSLPKSSSSKRSHVMSESSEQGGSRQSTEASTRAGAPSETPSKKQKSAIVGLPPPRSQKSASTHVSTTAAAAAASASAFSDMRSQLHRLTDVFQTSMAAPISTSAKVHYADAVTRVQTVNDGMTGEEKLILMKVFKEDPM